MLTHGGNTVTLPLALSSLRELRVIIMLGLWELWQHINDMVFDGATPSLQMTLRNIDREGRNWRADGLLQGDLDFFFSGLVRWMLWRVVDLNSS